MASLKACIVHSCIKTVIEVEDEFIASTYKKNTSRNNYTVLLCDASMVYVLGG